MILLSKRMNVDFKINIAMRNPLHEKEYFSIYNKKISVSKIYPQFNLPVVFEEDCDQNVNKNPTLNNKENKISEENKITITEKNPKKVETKIEKKEEKNEGKKIVEKKEEKILVTKNEEGI